MHWGLYIALERFSSMHRSDIMICVGGVMSALGVFRALEDILSALEVFSALEDISSALGRYQYCYGASPMH